MDFKNMSDSELATIMVNQISRVENLKYLIGTYLDKPNHDAISEKKIKDCYQILKKRN